MPRYELVTSRYERSVRPLFAVRVERTMLRVSLLTFFLWAFPAFGAEHSFDVVVYGGTAGGAMAAIAVLTSCGVAAADAANIICT